MAAQRAFAIVVSAVMTTAACGADQASTSETSSTTTTASTSTTTTETGNTTSTAPHPDLRVVETSRLPSPVLVWTTRGDIVVLRRDMAATKVQDGGAADWVGSASLASDGQAVYLRLPAADTCGELARFDLSSETVESLGIEGDHPLPSPDGRRLAFVRRSPRWPICGTELVIRHLDTRQEQVWRSDDETMWPASPVAWSPDGRMLLIGISWESPTMAGLIDTTEGGGVFGPSEELQPTRVGYEWRPETFLADGRIAHVGHCCWYYIPEHRDPDAVDREPYLLLATPGGRPVESGDNLPHLGTRLHSDGEHYLWVDDEGVIWLATADNEPHRVAEGALSARW